MLNPIYEISFTLLSQVFMCQLEGSKHWRLYGPREEGERLPRFSSPNFDQDEVFCLVIRRSFLGKNNLVKKFISVTGG